MTIVNQTDAVESTDGEGKLGRPMLLALFLLDWGALFLFLLPGSRERIFTGSQGRLRPTLHVDVS